MACSTIAAVGGKDVELVEKITKNMYIHIVVDLEASMARFDHRAKISVTGATSKTGGAMVAQLCESWQAEHSPPGDR